MDIIYNTFLKNCYKNLPKNHVILLLCSAELILTEVLKTGI